MTGLISIIVTVVVAVFGATWYLATRLEKIYVTGITTAKTLGDHVVEDRERDTRQNARFDEVFSQQRELAKQNFWLLANNNGKTAQSRKSKADLQRQKAFAQEN